MCYTLSFRPENKERTDGKDGKLFSYVRKISEDRGFCCFPTVPDLLICQENRRSSKKTGTRLENENASNFPDLLSTTPDDRDVCDSMFSYWGWQNLGRSGNSEIRDRLGFSRHTKTRLKFAMFTLNIQILLVLKVKQF